MYFIEVQLVYNVVFISVVHQSDSVMCVFVYIYIYTHTFFFMFFSILVYHRILSTVLCDIQ